MKKTAIFSLVACAVGACFLLAILVIALNSEGLGIKTELPADAEIEWAYTYEYSWDPEETSVSGLDIQWGDGNVTLKTSKGGLIHIKEYSNKELTEETKLELSSSGGVLTIRENGDLLSKLPVNIAILKKEEKELVVAVPAPIAAELKELRCSNASGDVSIADFAANELEVSSVSGDVRLARISCETGALSTTSGDIFTEELVSTETLSTDTTSGKMTVNGSAASLELGTTSGNVSFTGEAAQINADTISANVDLFLDNCPEISNLEAVSGRLRLAIPESSGFELDYSSVSGELRSDFPIQGNVGRTGRAIYGTGECSFRLRSTSGDMEILCNK